MTRQLTSGVQTAISAEHVTACYLLDLEFASGTLYITNAPHDLVWSGNTYVGCHALMMDNPRETQTQEIAGLRIGLPGTNASLVALALSEFVQGKPVIVRLALFDASLQIIADPVIEWSGRMDTMAIVEGNEDQSSTIVLTCEHEMAHAQRAKVRRHNLVDHQREFPGDRFYEFAASLVDKRIVWPSASFFRR